MKISIDEEARCLNSECTYAAPALFRIERGTLHWQPDVPAGQEDAAREAVSSCPAFAIEIVEE